MKLLGGRVAAAAVGILTLALGSTEAVAQSVPALNIPAAVVGVDLEGMVAFVNADAEALLGKDAPLLGYPADMVLPEALRPVWRAADQTYHDVFVAGSAYRVVCRAVGDDAQSRGRLLVIVPSRET